MGAQQPWDRCQGSYCITATICHGVEVLKDFKDIKDVLSIHSVHEKGVSVS